MDITNIPQQLIKALEQKNTEQLAILSKVLNLVVGKTMTATVVSTEVVTPRERDLLLKQTQTALAQLTKTTPPLQTPAVKAEIARLVQQQQILQSPQLKWVSLLVNNKPLTTYTDQPLQQGQAVPVQLQTPQKLVLLNVPHTPAQAADQIAQTDTPESSSGVKDQHALNQLLKAAILELINKSSTTPNTQLAKAILAANLPAHMLTAAPKAAAQPSPLIPTQQLSNSEKTSNEDIGVEKKLPTPISQNTAAGKLQTAYATNPFTKLNTQTQDEKLLDTVVKKMIGENLRQLLPFNDEPHEIFNAAHQIQLMPAAKREKLLTPSLEQALKRVAEQLRSPVQLAQPKMLAQTFKNSGIFFENRLHKAIKNDSDPKPSVDIVFKEDLKGALLNLVNKSGLDTKPLPQTQLIPLLQLLANSGQIGTRTDLAKNLGALIQQLMGKTPRELSNKELRSHLLTLLQEHGLRSLAKIELQQLHSLSQALERKETGTSPNSWQLDIPVKYEGQPQHINVHIEREWVEEKNEAKATESAAKIKQWTVTMRFDLPSMGGFCAQLAVADTRVKATLWADRNDTYIRTLEQLQQLRDQLEKEGITVNQLQCLQGMPPEKPLNLSYSLIDVST